VPEVGALDIRASRVLPVLLGIGFGAITWQTGVGPETPVPLYQVLVIIVAVAVTELLPIKPPRGRPVPTSTAVIATGALIGVDAPVLAVLAAVGWTLAGLVDRRSGAVPSLVVAVTTAWFLGGLAASGRTFGTAWQGAPDSEVGLHLVAAALVVTVLIALLPALQVSVLGELTRFPMRRIVDEIRATWSADLAIASTAVMGALVHRPLGIWTLPSMLVPLLAARIGLDRFAGVTTAYDQTIRAMSRLPEQLGTVGPDHGVRVGQLARKVAIELGVDASSALEIEQAAYLHELGHIRLEPEDQPTRAELAQAGARVIASAGDLDGVAAIVAAHGDPDALRSASPELARAARVVAACCELDRYAPDLAITGQRREVTVRLVRDVDDLDVVRALLAVLERAGTFAGTRR
jgi:hypothetical protein